MKKYLLALYQPDGPPPPPPVLDDIMRDVEALNRELRAAGAYVMAAGLHPPSTATVLRREGGTVIATDGPFAESKEHLGGFTIVQAPHLEAALAWGRRLAQATTLPVEVRALAERS
jgi:hypothetical protein